MEMKQKIDRSESSIMEALGNAENALQKIKASMLKQKNMSIDIKTGVDTIVEALDKIESTKKAEVEAREAYCSLLEPNANVDLECQHTDTKYDHTNEAHSNQPCGK